MTHHEHETEPGDVDTDLEHRCGEDDVVRVDAALVDLHALLEQFPALTPALGRVEGGVEGDRHLVEGLGDPGAGDSRGELVDVEGAEVRAGATWQAGRWAPLGQGGLDVVLHVAGHACQFAGGVEVADEGQVRVGGRTATVEDELGR